MRLAELDERPEDEGYFCRAGKVTVPNGRTFPQNFAPASIWLRALLFDLACALTSAP